MKLYNTKTHATEEFTPPDHEVTLYVCGITPYDTTHLGHAFTYTSYDQLIRYLESKGIAVRYAQNVTDIDDDILQAAKEIAASRRTTAGKVVSDLVRAALRPPRNDRLRNGVPLLPRRSAGAARPTMRLVNHLRDEP